MTAPDLTESVLRRLGLAGVTPGAAKRRRRRRAFLRATLCAVVVGAGGLVVTLLSSQPQPLAPTVPSAIRHDLQQHGRTIDRTVRTIRGIAQQLPTLTVPASSRHDGPDAHVNDDGVEPSI
ncbi:MAG: hypothetical protein V3S08_03160 [Phycisphaerales bacterium]